MIAQPQLPNSACSHDSSQNSGLRDEGEHAVVDAQRQRRRELGHRLLQLRADPQAARVRGGRARRDVERRGRCCARSTAAAAQRARHWCPHAPASRPAAAPRRWRSGAAASRSSRRGLGPVGGFSSRKSRQRRLLVFVFRRVPGRADEAEGLRVGHEAVLRRRRRRDARAGARTDTRAARRCRRWRCVVELEHVAAALQARACGARSGRWPDRSRTSGTEIDCGAGGEHELRWRRDSVRKLQRQLVLRRPRYRR